ncbi:MAG: hypothetical protein PF692_08725 [Kiritimatiellae bacterium]|jgi:hypothetical protein|nr:hypothetical protein [Kiritimatiellia bacterium]
MMFDSHKTGVKDEKKVYQQNSLGEFGSIAPTEIGEWDVTYGADYIDLTGHIPLPFGTVLIVQ